MSELKYRPVSRELGDLELLVGPHKALTVKSENLAFDVEEHALIRPFVRCIFHLAQQLRVLSAAVHDGVSREVCPSHLEVDETAGLQLALLLARLAQHVVQSPYQEL